MKKLKYLFPGLLDSGLLFDSVYVIRDLFVNVYLIKTSRGLLLIDTGFRKKTLLREIHSLGLNIRDVFHVFLTHWHWDHSLNVALFPHADLYAGSAHSRDLSVHVMPHNTLLDFGDTSVKIIASPGHTHDSLSFLINDRYLFTGDTLRFHKGKVLPFHWLWNKNTPLLKQTMEKDLLPLPQVSVIFSSHSGIWRKT